MKKRDFEEILKNYSLGKYKSSEHIWWAFGNTVFILKTSKGKYLLKKFHSSNNRKINFQVEVMELLNSKGLPVPKIHRTKKGKLILKYKSNFLILQKFVEGKATYSFTKALVKDCAKILSKTDKILKNLRKKPLFEWKKNHQFNSRNLTIKKVENFNLKQESVKIEGELKRINRSKLSKSLIHSDAHGINLLSRKNKIVALIDFDDLHYDYLSEEIAVFLTCLVHKDKIYKDFIRVFVNEYKKELPLNKEEKKAIYYFMKKRFLGAIDWTEKHKRKLKDKKKIEKTNKNIQDSIKSYLNLDKISLDEFIGIIS